MRRALLLAVPLALLGPALLSAQRTADRARLIISVGLGQTSGGGQLWRVDNQPLQISQSQVDTMAVSRAFRRTLNIDFGATYFPTENFGLNVDAQLLGLGTADDCAVGGSSSGGGVSQVTTAICRAIRGSERSATSATLSVGGVYRVAPHSNIHPYVRANVGLMISQQSFVKLRPVINDSEFRIFNDDDPDNTQPYVGLGGGVVAVIGRGYQLRFEVRDNWVRVPKVTGSTAGFTGGEPPTKTVGRHLLSVTVGFDVVLERKRGRRY